MNRRSLEAALNKPYVPVPRYGGALKEADYNARSALVTLAYDERYFAADRGSWAVGEGFRRPAEVWGRPRAGRDGSKLARSEIEVKLASELTTEKTGFVFDARTEGDSLVLSATPERYGKSGFVSLRLRITPEMVRETNEDDFCVVSYEAIRGGDYAGNPAPDTAEPFVPPWRKLLDYPCL